MRLIDADALGIGRCKEGAFEIRWYALGWNSAIDIIENAPTVDAEPVRHGEWVKMVFTDSGKFAGYKCSECGLIAKREFSYCHCGAKMDGGKQDAQETTL